MSLGAGMTMRDDERRWAWGWHGPLNLAAMHVSGVLFLACLGALTSASGADLSYAQHVGLVLWVVVVHVGVQVPVAALASRWAARGRARRAGAVAVVAAAALTWVLCLPGGEGALVVPPILWWRTSAALCVSLGAYPWLCTLRRSTVRRLAGRLRSYAETADLWLALRLTRGR